MPDDIVIRPAKPKDAGDIVEIIRSGMEPDLLPMLIYGCSGIRSYVADQICASQCCSDAIYYVACSYEKPVGCVEFRLLPSTLFLNYISILPEYRAMGLGRKMLAKSISLSTQIIHPQNMILDVMGINTKARKWYANLGFSHDHTQVWYVMPLDTAGHSEKAFISGYPQAKACHERFGFSQFRVITSTAEYTVGMMGENWFRITQPEAMADDALHGTLLKIDPSRRLLAILPEDIKPSNSTDNVLCVASNHRLIANIELLVQRI